LSDKSVEFTSPVGRIVWGSLYEPRTKDFDGNPLTKKHGPDAGKPDQRFEFGLAVPKTAAHWAQESWGRIIWETAHAAFPGGDRSPAMSPTFSWKITDGDSKVISAKSKSKIPPCEREGYAGHWVLTFSSVFAPRIYDARDVNNPILMDLPNAIVPGYAVQVIGTVAGNTGASPGIYLNHNAVGLRAYMPEIRTTGVDVTGKFGGALPPGASTVPVGGFAASAPAPAAVPPAYVAPPTAAAPVAVVPAPAMLGIPPTLAPPPPPAATPAAPARAPHKGIPYESYIKGGWSHAQLVADGYRD
jgi:hypothetical protein